MKGILLVRLRILKIINSGELLMVNSCTVLYEVGRGGCILSTIHCLLNCDREIHRRSWSSGKLEGIH